MIMEGEVREILDHWNTKNIIRHLKVSEGRMRQLVKRWKYRRTFCPDDDPVLWVKGAIDNYSEVLDGECFFNYRWTLEEFLLRDNASKFYPENYVRDNWLPKKPSSDWNATTDKILTAIRLFGSAKQKEARQYIGSDGFKIVEDIGGWRKLCLAPCDSSILKNMIQSRAKKLR